MKISYNWLKQYIDITESPEELGKILTSTGLEVESIEAFETVRGGMQGLVVGEVLTCAKHPNADKLSLTTVNVGGDKVLPIVCGAPNVAAGQKVIVALPGTTVYPFKGDPFTIKSAKIRGEVSEGMICAEDEIGLGESHAGIIVLNANGAIAPANGTPAATVYHIESDFVFEIGLTPNRADAASHIGVARDIKAAKLRTILRPSVDTFKADNHDLSVKVSVANHDACLRYSAVTLTGVTVGESPDWLKNRLKSIGLNPINNIVDITNFVLHETGQPLHAFDAAVTGKEVIVKTLAAGTKFKTLDGKERTLAANDLMICNAAEGMCIAGIFGGVQSGITSSTHTIFLESACFSPVFVRKTAQTHQLKTDASFRFERGTDPNITVYALQRAALLIREIAGGKISSEVTDIYPNPIEHRMLEIKDKNVNRLIGKVIPRETMFPILEALEIQVVSQQDDRFMVSVPPYRVDVTQEADVIEEILRIYGFNNIPLSDHAGTDYLSAFPQRDINKFRKSVGELLTGNGFYEILTNSLTNAAYQKKHNLTFIGEAVEILNKLSEEQGILRQTLLFSGLEVCSYNINRKQKDLKVYEFGKIYWSTPAAGAEGKATTSDYHEEERLALFLSGNQDTENWQNKTRPVGYFELAQSVHDIFERCLPGQSAQLKQERLEDPLFEYGMKWMKGKAEIGKVGKVKTAFTRDLSIKQEIFYADLSASLLFKSANPKFEVQEVPKFPEVRRDLSLVLDKQVTFSQIRELVLATEKRLIRDIVVFDVYEGDNIPKGKKAYALAFTLLDETKTLTDGEIDKTMAKLISAFEQKMEALIRK